MTCSLGQQHGPTSARNTVTPSPVLPALVGPAQPADFDTHPVSSEQADLSDKPWAPVALIPGLFRKKQGAIVPSSAF